jgi:hypothetical protein
VFCGSMKLSCCERNRVVGGEAENQLSLLVSVVLQVMKEVLEF